jgi:hypothetical protein
VLAPFANWHTEVAEDLKRGLGGVTIIRVTVTQFKETGGNPSEVQRTGHIKRNIKVRVMFDKVNVNVVDIGNWLLANVNQYASGRLRLSFEYA